MVTLNPFLIVEHAQKLMTHDLFTKVTLVGHNRTHILGVLKSLIFLN